MEPTTTSFEITAADTAFIKSYLKDKRHPVPFNDLAYQIAMFKTADKRHSQVKLYDPDCEYKVGDQIYKEYPGSLPVGNKKTIELSEGVILKVEEVRALPGMNAIRLSYDGTSDFRRYTEYLKKQKIELLLPHRQQKPPAEAQTMAAEQDPRSTEQPLIDREFRELKRKLTTVLNRETDIAFICDRVLLMENLRPIAAEVFDAIKEFLKGHGQSESTEFFAENFVKVDPASADFDSTCFALNYLMTHQHKVYLRQTLAEGWGRWHLNSMLSQVKKNALVSEANPLLGRVVVGDRQALAARRREFEQALFSEGENRYYLTLREIASGALRLHPGAYHFGEALEIQALDTGTKKTYTLFHYPDENLLLGLGKLFDAYKAIQGTILVFEQTPLGQFELTIKTSKKGTIADRIVWDAEKRLFRVSEEKISSPVFVNKAIHLESDVFQLLAQRLEDYRKLDSYNKLIHKIFLEFGAKEKNYEMSILRLYHILDLIYPVDLRSVVDIVLASAEFIPSEKIPGTIYLDSDAVVEIEEEERERRTQLIEESKRKREELRRLQLEEEQRQKDEIRRVREERRKKREDEMFQHDHVQVAPPKPDAVPEFAPVADRGRRVEAPLEPPVERGDAAKKQRKKVNLAEKPIKTVKKGAKKILEEKIEMDEIKKQILGEDNEEPLAEAEELLPPVSEDEAAVVYQDEGGFGGIFAKLDEIVKKDEDNEEPRSTKKKKKK